MKKYLLCFLIAAILLFSKCSQDFSSNKAPVVENIIFLIGDGMAKAMLGLMKLTNPSE